MAVACMGDGDWMYLTETTKKRKIIPNGEISSEDQLMQHCPVS